MSKISVVFFGSFLHYSAYVLESLVADPNIVVASVVTTPPVVDKKGEHKNPVHLVAEKHKIPVFTPSQLNQDTLDGVQQSHHPIDFFITAGYGKLLPLDWLKAPKTAALNLHLSLLPIYRGANPGEWALLNGEDKSGVTLIEMSPVFDTGAIIARSSVGISADETRETLYEKLYQHGASILPSLLSLYVHNVNGVSKDLSASDALKFTGEVYFPPLAQPSEKKLYARRLNRNDGYVSWQCIEKLMVGEPVSEELQPALFRETTNYYQLPITNEDIILFLERASRALVGYPSLWTEVPTHKGLVRMKILTLKESKGKLLLGSVHLAGKQPSQWNQVKNSIAEF